MFGAVGPEKGGGGGEEMHFKDSMNEGVESE